MFFACKKTSIPDDLESLEGAASEKAAYRTLIEHDKFIRELGHSLSTGAIVAFISLIALKLLVWGNHVASVSSSSGPRIILGPLSGSAAGTCFGILGAIAIALQIAVQHAAKQNTEFLKDSALVSATREFARLRFLIDFSYMIVIAAWFLGMYVALDSVRTYETLDLVAFFGPLIGAVAVAACAADATIVSNPEFANAENMRGAWRIKKLEIITKAYEATLGESSHEPRRYLWFKLGALALAPSLAVFGASLLLSSGDFATALVWSILELLLTILIFAATYGTFYDYMMRSYTNAAAYCLLGGSVSIMVTLTFVVSQVNSLLDGEALSNVLGSILGFMVIFLVPIWLGFRSLSFRRRSLKPGLLRQLVLDQLKNRKETLIEKMDEDVLSKPSTKNPLASFALLLGIAPPVGAVLGITILKRTGVRKDDSRSDQAGRKRAITAIVANVVLFVGVLITPVVLAQCLSEDFCLVPSKHSEILCTEGNC